jgi:hypothetical protein
VENLAQGSYSFAAGTAAYADAAGCFVFSDSSSPLYTACGGPGRFVARAYGGVRFYTGGSAPNYVGVELPPGGGAWNTLSDRDSKEHFVAASPREVLDRLAAMPVLTWNWKSQDAGIRHIGPTAQDFTAAFGFGGSTTTISTVDADGVAFAAIQGLRELVLDGDATLRTQAAIIEALERRIDALERASTPRR